MVRVDGRCREDGNARTMVFGVRQSVGWYSRSMTLEPGDIIATGTPPGAGMGFEPQPQFLKPSVVMRPAIEGLGVQQQRVYAWTPGLIDH
ncbi:MAG: fumarylacetoacetate hydrolase family protein [Nitrospira sp.]|nr:fumarylacetoacetate hydrolase family protein [Nitrospira sp.]